MVNITDLRKTLFVRLKDNDFFFFLSLSFVSPEDALIGSQLPNQLFRTLKEGVE